MTENLFRLFLVGYPRVRSLAPDFSTATLDNVIAAICSWNIARAEEHHPKFWDWEKENWINLKRWRGCLGITVATPKNT